MCIVHACLCRSVSNDIFSIRLCFIYLFVFVFMPRGILYMYGGLRHINTLRPRQNGRHFPDDILKLIFLNENVWISIEISLKFVSKGQINNIPALVQIMAWRRPGDKPSFEPMMVNLLTHMCVTRPQWVKIFLYSTEIHCIFLSNKSLCTLSPLYTLKQYHI